MKKVLTRSLLCTVLIFSVIACRKTTENVVDCFGESLLVSIKHETVGDQKTVRYTLAYSGEHKITAVTFDYGDGKTEVVTNNTAVHTYTSAGAYTFKAAVKLQEGTASCEVYPEKQITIN